jgi:hypothetical protein
MSLTDDGSGGGRKPDKALLDFWNKPKTQISGRKQEDPARAERIRQIQTDVRAWAYGGFSCRTRTVTYRPQTRYPNTFCIIYENVTIGGHAYDWVCLDIHYKTDGSMQALGGLWIKGVGGDLKPQQSRDLRAALLLNVPSAAPSNTGTTYDSVMSRLLH